MTDGAMFLTTEKKAALEHELDERKTDTRSAILERLAFAKSLGDLSENAEYHSSKEEQGKNEARINEIEHILKYAKIVEANTDGTVGVGSTIILEKNDTKESKTYMIVGAHEADVLAGKMSFDSPIGKAVMDKQAGDTVTVTTPKGETKYTIKNVQ